MKLQTLLGTSMITMWCVLLTGCNVIIDAPQTPTVISSPPPDETAVARLPTQIATRAPSPSMTSTSTLTPSVTVFATPTIHLFTDTPTATQTQTQTPTSTPRRSPSSTSFPTPSVAFTATPTMRLFTVTPTATQTQVRTPTSTPTATESITQLSIPTATPVPTHTITSFPTATATQPPTLTPFVATPILYVPTAPYLQQSGQPTTISDAGGIFHDPNAPPSASTALPVAPMNTSGPSVPMQLRLPEHSAIVVSYAGQIVPILDLDGPNTNVSEPLAHGQVFAISASGHLAAVGPDRKLYVDNAPMTISPASIYGMPANLNYGDVAWSPNGMQVALRIDALDPSAQDAIDSGVWIYEPASSRSWQIFRNTYSGQTTQIHEQRQASQLTWSPNGTAMLITVNTPLGKANIFMPIDHNANESINAIPYAEATWSADSASLIVSGPTWDGMTVLGQVQLDAQWTYTEYQNQVTNGLWMQAGIRLQDARLAFLGSATSETTALYTVSVSPHVQPDQVSPVLTGRVIASEWNRDRTALLATLQAGSNRRLWLIRIDGTVQDVTPSFGIPDSAHWR